LHCNFDTSKLNVDLPLRYKQCLDVWSELNAKVPNSFQDIVNEIVWNNRFCCISKKSTSRRDIVDLGYLKIGDLISANCFTFDPIHSPLNPEQSFFVMRIVNSVSPQWRSIIKNSTILFAIDSIPNVPFIRTEEKSVPVLDISSKRIYRLFLEKKHVPPTAKQKLMTKYPNIVLDWKNVYSLAFQTTLESKIREFQYKILNRIVFTNENYIVLV